MADGRYDLGGQTVDVSAGVARLAGQGAMAGSTLTMDAHLHPGWSWRITCRAQFEEPVDYFMDARDGLLTLHFTLPLKTPVKSKELSLDVYDPTFFVDFKLAEQEPAKLVGAPAACQIKVQRPADGTASARTLGEQNFADGGNLTFGVMFANKITVNCP